MYNSPIRWPPISSMHDIILCEAKGVTLTSVVKPKRLGEPKEENREGNSDGRMRRSNVTVSRNAAISHPYLICQAPLRAFSAPPTTLRFLCRPARFSWKSPNLLPTPKIDSLPVTPYLPSHSLPPKRAENLNSLLGLLIPRIDAEFRARSHSYHLPPSIRDHLRSSARPFESSFVRPAVRHDPYERGAESGRAGKFAVSIGTVRDSVGITTIDRAGTRGTATAATSKLYAPASLHRTAISPFSLFRRLAQPSVGRTTASFPVSEERSFL